MPITQAEAKKRLAELCSQGGGIITGAAKSEIEANSRILVIGIGGLGCKTVNELVGVYRRDFDDQGRLSWLAIDTDIRCFNKIDSLNGGNIDRADMYSLYSPEVQHLLQFPRSPYINSFVHNEVPPYPITNQGAQQRRTVGKVMLCGGPAYGELRSRIAQRINAMGGGAGGIGMQIIIVAGISGGTGSGTFIDISYMVRELAKDNPNNSVFGVFYTPDVQRNETFVTPAIWDILQRNGYASMKELDYFMSVGYGDHVVYSLPLNTPIDINGNMETKLESKLPIFDREYVFFISETDTNSSESDIIGATAISLLNLFRESAKIDGENTQNILSNLCNIKGVIDTWGNNNIGKSNDPNRQGAGIYGESSKMKYTNHPVSMHYNYASFDYKSIYIPRNEMAAYCINLILNDLLHNKFFKAINSIGNGDIEQFAQTCGLDSLEKVYATADALNGWHNFSFRIEENSAAYPQPEALRVKCDASAAVNKAREIANNAISNANADMNRIWDTYNGLIETNLFNNAALWNLVGPYGAIVFMSGMKDGSVAGLIDRVHNLTVELPGKLQLLQNARDLAEASMTNYKNELAEDIHVTDAETVRMVDLCEAYSKSEYEYQLYAQAMPVVLNTIETRLVELNNKTFETYVPIMKAIEEIVNEDANRFMHSTLQKNGYGSVFCVDAFNIDNALANSELFEGFFEGYLNNQEVIDAEQGLFSTLFGTNYRGYWEALASDDDQERAATNAVNKIREVFKTVTDPLISGMLEKFLVMIYCDPNIFKAKVLQPGENRKITLADLNNFWDNNPNERDVALQIVAEKIYSELNRGSMIKYSVSPEVSSVFDSQIEIISISDLPRLNNILSNMLPTNGAFHCADSNAFGNPKTEIALFKNAGPFPLPFVYRMRDYALRYFSSETNYATMAGRHGDEVTGCWQENMPELYGVDADQYFSVTMAVEPISPDQHPGGNHDKMVFEEVRSLVKSALEGGYLYLPENNPGENARYKLVILKKSDYVGDEQLTVDILMNKTIDKLAEMLRAHDIVSEGPDALPTWIDAVKALGEEEHHNKNYYLTEQYLDTNISVINSNFAGVQAKKPEFEYEISNLERLVRMDMTVLNKVRAEAKFYEEKDFFGEIERIKNALRREQGMTKLIGYYLAAYKLGWILTDKGHLICKAPTGQTEDLLNCSNGFTLDLDKQLESFLKISAFCSAIEANDSMQKRIQSAYAPFQVTDQLLSPEQLTTKQAMPDWKTDILEPLKTAMDSDAFNDYDMEKIYKDVYRKFGLSRYQNTYGYPTTVNHGKDIIDNVNKVIESLNHFVEVGDGMLVPDLD